jgi:hypothetical protein
MPAMPRNVSLHRSNEFYTEPTVNREVIVVILATTRIYNAQDHGSLDKNSPVFVE